MRVVYSRSKTRERVGWTPKRTFVASAD